MLLSLSTGRSPAYLDAHNADWGWAQWAIDLRLIGVMLDGNTGLAHYQSQRILGERYHRLDPLLPQKIDMDDIKAMPVLREVAEQTDLTATIAWLEQLKPHVNEKEGTARRQSRPL